MKSPRQCLTICLLALGCSSAPRPAVLDQTKVAAESDNLSQARRLAPQAFAHAESLRISAEDAQAQGRSQLASALAEHALVAFKRAAVQAQKVEATERIARAQQATRTRQEEIAKLSGLQEEIAAATKRLELQVEVATNALPRAPVEAEPGHRAVARTEAARSITEAARLLCVAARLLAPSDANALTTLQATEALLSQVATLPAHEALGRAMDQRVACLSVLTRLKRSAANKALDAGDELLASLSPSFADLRPHRDDRGVVLTALGAWDGHQLTPSGRDVVDRITKLAGARRFPLMVVLQPVSSSGTGSSPAVQTELQKQLPPGTSVVQATSVLPSLLELPQREKQASRMEFIFVTP